MPHFPARTAVVRTPDSIAQPLATAASEGHRRGWKHCLHRRHQRHRRLRRSRPHGRHRGAALRLRRAGGRAAGHRCGLRARPAVGALELGAPAAPSARLEPHAADQAAPCPCRPMRHVAGGAGVARQPALPADVRTRLPVRHHAGAPRHPDRQRVLLSGPPVPP
ncbi:hypothetical protein G6F35_017545 [Rhizopus arrhizus]|nr:hypothetical protein G6F35_017545 [Rhizopus arrhizus]